MRLEHHLVGGYVRYISPYIIIIIIIIKTPQVWLEFEPTNLIPISDLGINPRLKQQQDSINNIGQWLNCTCMCCIIMPSLFPCMIYNKHPDQ